MKILMIQKKGAHAENWEFQESQNFKRAFTRLNVPCVVWGMNYENYDIPFHEIQKDCDVIFILANYETQWLPDLSSVHKLKIFWSEDSHCVLSEHLNLCKKHGIDILLNATSHYLQFFETLGIKCHWFPNAYPADLIYSIGIEKTGVGFCGSIGKRGEYIEALKKSIGMKHDNFVIGNSMVKAINSYKIGWNRNLSNDINCRTFETLGCGTFLITNETDKLRDIFEIEKHLITYDSLGDCTEKIKYYMEHDNERKQIEEQGHIHALNNHTYDKRATQLIEIINAI
jgi:hypothetical protein